MAVYFDNSATTPLCSEALDAIVNNAAIFGNPSSLHSLGIEAEHLFSDSKREILSCLSPCDGCDMRNLIITASGTEANNLAVCGTVLSKPRYKNMKILTDDSEHPSVLEAMRRLESLGFNVVKIHTVGGELDFDAIEKEAENVCFASFMLVNNETGAVYDVRRAFDTVRAKSPDAVCHCDAVQGFLKIPFSQKSLGADLISISAHKIEGPKGIGALYVSNRVIKMKSQSPVIYGGGQESGLRSGTENTLFCAAFAAACKKNSAADTGKIKELREYLECEISKIGGVEIHKPKSHAPHILNIAVPGVKSEVLLRYFSAEEIYISSGSACSSHKNTESYVLLAFGIERQRADSSLRISLGYENTKEDADRFLSVLRAATARFIADPSKKR